MKWSTLNLKNLLRVANKTLHQVCKIYQDVRKCGKSYTGATAANIEVRWNEHNNSTAKNKFI